ncbi:hypothetical protein FQZ97_914030 [compost metagenome]
MMKSCGSPRTGWSASSTIFSPDMSMICSFSACSGPTGRKRSFENLQPTARYLPSAAMVSDCEPLMWPGWYCTSRRSTTYLAALSPAWNLIAASTFHFTIWLSRNSVV